MNIVKNWGLWTSMEPHVMTAKLLTHCGLQQLSILIPCHHSHPQEGYSQNFVVVSSKNGESSTLFIGWPTTAVTVYNNWDALLPVQWHPSHLQSTQGLMSLGCQWDQQNSLQQSWWQTATEEKKELINNTAPVRNWYSLHHYLQIRNSRVNRSPTPPSPSHY